MTRATKRILAALEADGASAAMDAMRRSPDDRFMERALFEWAWRDRETFYRDATPEERAELDAGKSLHLWLGFEFADPPGEGGRRWSSMVMVPYRLLGEKIREMCGG